MSVSQYKECQNYIHWFTENLINEGHFTLDCRAKNVSNKDENEGEAGKDTLFLHTHISQDQRNRGSIDCTAHPWDLGFQALSVLWVKISFEAQSVEDSMGAQAESLMWLSNLLNAAFRSSCEAAPRGLLQLLCQA